MLKRFLDIIGSAIGLVGLSPLLALLALLVRITSGKPVLYRWKVVGKGGRYFTGYKFRTMVVNAEELRKSLAAYNKMTGPVFKMERDPRVTPLGRWLRRLSIDELPQLWSVFTGDMSLVGPRPLHQHEYESLDEWQKSRFAVTPGITCLWQISGRNEITDMDEWIKLDLEYIERWSLWLDFKILVRTIPAVLSGRGAS
jgi:lipopolysaccharide/colanic/teichoic acid biosynthesis glycosyltransferase